MTNERTNDRAPDITPMLLSFIDFLYAGVFGLILAKTFEDVITKEGKFLHKSGNVLLLIGVFYFLAWDWLHGRLLTIRNPYRRYRRFFMEALIAFCGYGAALDAIGMKVSFLIYVACTLFLGAVWAHSTMKECPQTTDVIELNIIKVIQPVMAFGILAFYLFWRTTASHTMTFRHAVVFVLFGWISVFNYESFVPRPVGIEAGPGVPFVNKEKMDRVRAFMLTLAQRLRRR